MRVGLGHTRWNGASLDSRTAPLRPPVMTPGPPRQNRDQDVRARFRGGNTRARLRVGARENLVAGANGRFDLTIAPQYGRTHGWSRRRLIPHGGHQLALNMAAGLQLGGSESYPLVFQPFGGFADLIPIEDGYTHPHDSPGVGVELKAELYTELKKLASP